MYSIFCIVRYISADSIWFNLIQRALENAKQQNWRNLWLLHWGLTEQEHRSFILINPRPKETGRTLSFEVKVAEKHLGLSAGQHVNPAAPGGFPNHKHMPPANHSFCCQRIMKWSEWLLTCAVPLVPHVCGEIDNVWAAETGLSWNWECVGDALWSSLDSVTLERCSVPNTIKLNTIN